MKQLSTPTSIDITGWCVPHEEKQPVLVDIEGELFAVVFDSIDKLTAAMALLGKTNYGVWRIDDSYEFTMSCMEGGVGLAGNVRIVAGNTRFTMIVPVGAPETGTSITAKTKA